MQSSNTPSSLDTTTTIIQSDPTSFHPTPDLPNYFSSSSTWDRYHDVRPAYPLKLFDLIFTYHARTGGNLNLAADFGSGPGTIVPQLLTRFARVEASDLNPWQVETGRRFLQFTYGADRVSFHQGAAEDPHWLADDSVDLFTAAEAVQWFDMEAWGREAGKKLKSGGTLAIWYYGCNATVVEPEGEAAPLCNRLFSILFEATWSQSGFPKRALLPHVTKLDCLSLPDEYFDKDKEERHLWHLPSAVAGPFVLGENAPTSRALFDEEELLLVVDASREAKRFEYSGDDGEEGCFLKQEGWTTVDLLEYIKSLGMPMENLLCSPDYQPTLDALHDVLGGPAGTFTAGWWLSLVLATRK